MAILQLLNFGSGYRVELKRLTGRGAFDTIRALVIALHISQGDLSAKGLEKAAIDDIASMAQIPISEEVDHPTIQGLKVEKPTKLAKLAKEIVFVLRSTGEILRSGGYQSLGTFIIECGKRSQGSASVFVHHVPIPYEKTDCRLLKQFLGLEMLPVLIVNLSIYSRKYSC